jgi:hypothetical protein
MTKQVITTADAPAAIGPYSQAIRVGNLVFTSGQIPLHPQTGDIVGETAAEQARQVLQNLQAVLQAAGGVAAKRGKNHHLPHRPVAVCGGKRGILRVLPGEPTRAFDGAGGCPAARRAGGDRSHRHRGVTGVACLQAVFGRRH